MKAIVRPLIAAIFASSTSPLFADTLQDVYELALRNDAKLKSAEASYRANLETEVQAFSQLLPQVDGSASYSETDEDVESKNPFTNDSTGIPPSFLEPTITETDTEDEVYSVSLQQKVFDLPTWFNFKSGKAITQQAEAQLAADQQSLIVRVSEAYFNVLRAKDNLTAAIAEEQATKRQLDQTQQRYDVGLIAITDVHEARATYDNTVVQRLTFEGDLGTAYEALTVLTGSFHNNLWELDADYAIVDPTPVDRDEWVQFALKNNYQLAAASAATEASRQSAKAKKMEHMPKVTASYTYNDSTREGDSDNQITNISDDFYTETDGSTWGVTLTIPIY